MDLRAAPSTICVQHRAVAAAAGELGRASQSPEKGAGEGCFEFTFCLLMTL